MCLVEKVRQMQGLAQVEYSKVALLLKDLAGVQQLISAMEFVDSFAGDDGEEDPEQMVVIQRGSR